MQRFVTESGAIDRVHPALESAKQDAASTIALRKEHTEIIQATYRAGALSDREHSDILERYTVAYATPNIDEAQNTLDATWTSFFERS